MYTPLSLIEGDCIDAEVLATIYENIEFFERCSRENPTRFKCQRIDVSASGQLSAEEICLTLPTQDGSTLAPTGVVDEQKLLLFDFSESITLADRESNARVVSRVVDVLCDDEVVETYTHIDLRSSLIMATFRCAPNAEIKVCTRTNLTFDLFSNRNGRRTPRLCGVMACLTDAAASESVSGVFIPPPIDPACCYGREALHLAIQNLRALQTAYALFGQVPGVQQFTFQDAEPHTVLSNATGETEFLLIGQSRVCVRNTSSSGGQVSVTIKPQIECDGQDIPCLERVIRLGPSFGGRERCVTIPFLSCGTCPPGSNLIVALQDRLDCSEETAPVAEGTGEITSVTQSYCVYTFEKAVSEFDSILSPSLGRCISSDTSVQLTASMEQLAAVCSAQSPVQLSTFEFDSIATSGSPAVIRPPSPWPPATPPPRPVPDPAPNKRWFITAQLTICGDRSARPNGNGLTTANATAILKCGGVELDRSAVKWRIADREIYNRCLSMPGFNSCYECPIDEPITIELESSLTGQNSGIPAPDTLIIDARAFCI